MKTILMAIGLTAIMGWLSSAGATDRQGNIGPIMNTVSTAEDRQAALIRLNSLANNHPFPAALVDTTVITYTGSAMWSWHQDIEVVGNYAYCASYYGLMVLNVSNPANPTIVSQLYFPGWSVYHPVLGGLPERDIEVEGNYAFMTAPCEGLKIIDISDPAAPVLAGSYDLADSCEAFWQISPLNGYVYAASYQGLEILDVSTSSNPHRVAGLPASYEYMSALVIKGGTLYLGGIEGLEVVNIADPLNPSMVSTYDIHCLSISLRNDWAYITSENGQLIIADISNPASPQFVDTIDCSGGLGPACVYGPYLYLDIDSLGGSQYNTLGIYSLTDPTSPSQVSRTALPNLQLVNIAVTGTRAYIPGWRGIEMIDVANPATPSLLGTYGAQVAQSVAVADGYAYLPGKDTLYVLDVSPPSNSVIVGQCPLYESSSDWKVAVSGDHAFVYGYGPKMQIINIFDPHTPAVEAQCLCSFRDIAVQDTLIFGVGGNILKIYGHSLPMTEIGEWSWANGWEFTGIRVRNDYAYISVNSGMVEPERKIGVLVVDISDPAAPDSIGAAYDTVAGTFSGGDIEIRDTFAYLPGCNHVMTIADPAKPAPISGSVMPNIFVPLTLAGNLLISPPEYFMPVWLMSDITDPVHPTSAQFNTIGFPTGAAYTGGYAYMMETVGMAINHLAYYSVGSGYFVTSLYSSGPGSLRDAIISANTNPGPDTLIFTVSGPIALTVPLPALVDDSTVILGSTAPGGVWSVVLDGSGISGGGDGLVIQSRDNVIEGLAISNFPGNGISVTGATSVRNKLTRNRIYKNSGLAIDLGADGVTPNDLNDVDTGPNHLLNFPIIDSAVCQTNGSYTIYGSAPIKATVEVYIAHPARDTFHPADPSGHGEAVAFLDSTRTILPTEAFSMTIPASVGHFSQITAIARDDTSNTSEFSQNVTLLPRPLIVVAYSPVNIIITDPDMLMFGKDSLGNDITGIPDGAYFITPNDSVVIYHPKLGEYLIQFVTEAGTPPGAMYSAIIKIDGTDQVAIAADEYAPISGTMATFTYDVEEGYHYINADANRDSTIDVGDAVFIINYVFKGGQEPYPTEAADANCDHVINVGDAVHIINYIFKGGPEPCAFEP